VLLLDPSRIAALLTAHPAAALPALFGAGLLTSLTPCIYPMIPITAAIVGGQNAGGASGGSRWRPIALTLTYVVGLSVVYAALGVIAGMSGTIFGGVSTNPWALFAMANILLLAALAMFDVIPVRLPAAIVSRAATAGTAGRYSGALIMGAMSGLVAAPCSAPVMATVLTWVATTKSAALGFLYLLTFSLGMCAILVVVGSSSGQLSRLPRAGIWMVRVKKTFGVVMLGMAEYYLIKMGQVYF